MIDAHRGRHVGSVDFETLNSWHTEAWRGLRVAVFGLGKTGFSVADTLVELGARVLVVTQQADPERARLLDVIGAELVVDERLDAPPTRLLDFEPQLVVANPGFPPTHPILRWAEGDADGQAGLPVWGDIELAWRLRDKVVRADGTPAEWITITGTNGKTTTTQLAATMLQAAGLRAAPAGNIGIPVLDAIRDPQGFDVLVIELSSHQLHRINLHGAAGELHPWASVCLNIAEDHLEWHGSFDAYRDAKAKIYANTKIACVYNKADEATMRMVEDADVEEGARAIGFGLGVPGPSDLGIIDGIVVDRAFLDERNHTALELTTLEELAVAGLSAPHVVANILAAAALARSFGVETGVIHEVLRTFRLDAHRIETVATEGGVTWVDDSKATNPHAADASLRAFPSVVWVVGGLLKGVEVDELVAQHVGRLRAAVLIGVNRDALRTAFRTHAPEVPVFEVSEDEARDAGVMAAAVRFAASVAQEGDTVLLAPSAASMDQFTDYADRGRSFADAVRKHLSEDSQ